MTERIRVAAGILRRGGRILACRRPPEGPHPGKWEFPGGKLEAAETAEACLARELREELGIAAAIGESLGGTIARYRGKPEIELRFFAIDRFEGEPDDRHYADLRWILPEDLPALDFLEGDREIVARLARGAGLPGRREAATGGAMSSGDVASKAKIVPVILSGGSGLRLWPLSRASLPKQLLPLADARTMLQATALRVSDPTRFHRPMVVCNDEQRFVIAEQLRIAGVPSSGLVLEPAARNTAPAAAVGAMLALEREPDALLLLLPADHVILDEPAFGAAIQRAAAAARRGFLAAFGIEPTSPQTGYGYVRAGTAIEGAPGAFAAAAFVEKPTRDVAERYLASGEYSWNSGMFLFPAALFLAELERFEPAVVAAARTALDRARRDLDFLRLDAEAFTASPSISIDYAVMERTERAAVVPASIGWTDVGSWSSLWEISERDDEGNARIGDVVLQESRNCYVRSEGPLVTTIGLEDVIVVATVDAVLVAAKTHDQGVKALVDRLKSDGHHQATLHRRCYRPWGYYESIDAGDRYQVKRITVYPGGKLSLQRHARRAEHWVVVNGKALVTHGEERIELHENESIYVPVGRVHRLENSGPEPLNLIEVQSGDYLGEDDIVRLADDYARD